MRDIKFRMYDKKAKIMSPVHLMEWGKVKDNLFYFRGYYECDKGEWSVTACNNVNKQTAVKCGTETVLVNRYELMQYTGLKEKNGREIYEGDIVRFVDFDSTGGHREDRVFTGVIKYQSGLYEIWKNNDSEFFEADGAFILNHAWLQDEEFEVIGNIYENSELLEETK